MKLYNVGIIGAGLQARRRIPAILKVPNSKIISITSKNLVNAKNLSKQYSIPLYKNWQEIVKDKNINIIIVATYPDSHAQITIEALKNGKHVLCEKPLAQTLEQGEKMIQASKHYKKILKCGFNHRFHPASLEAKKIIDSGRIGSLLFGRGIYGHSGRIGFEKEWRTNKKFSAGGILMEQGIHLIDLFLWYFGRFEKVFSVCKTLHFPIKPFEDCAFMILETKKDNIVSIQSSNMEWKNKFRLEIFGQEGYLSIDGIGGSYGTQTLTVGKKSLSGPFTKEVLEYRGDDISWKNEWLEFINAIERKKFPIEGSQDSLEAMRLVKAAYRSDIEGKKITL